MENTLNAESTHQEVQASTTPITEESDCIHSRATQEIACPTLDPLLIQTLGQSLNTLQLLQNEISEKIIYAQERGNRLDARIETLIQNNIQIDDRRQLFGQSVSVYVNLLKDVASEISGEIAFFTPYSTQNHPAIIKVTPAIIEQHKTVQDFINESIKTLKSQAKNIRKYLTISYSRYMYGFDAQERNLDDLEFVVARRKIATNKQA